MLIERKDKEKDFKPVTLTITIESLVELHELWHRLNLPTKMIRPSLGSSHKYPLNESGNMTSDLWVVIDRIEREYENMAKN